MNKDLTQLISVYRRVWQSVHWQPYPLDETILYSTDDNIIRKVLVQLNQLDPTNNPPPSVVETAATDVEVHLTVVGYEDEMILYWFTYFPNAGNSGYQLYRITNFTGPTVNLMEYGYLFGLPESSMAEFYMETFSRLNQWARLLDLPYRYEVELREDYMSFERNYKLSPPLTETKSSPVIKNSFWRRLWRRLLS